MFYYKNFVLSIVAVLLIATNAYAENNVSTKVKDKINDALVVSSIKYEYAKDKLLNPFHITVSSTNGLVKLKGELGTDTEYMQAIFLAHSVEDVIGVDAKALEVKRSSQPLEDATVTSTIYGLLVREKLFLGGDFSFWPVKIETKEGKVYLSGLLNSKADKEVVIKIANKVAGEKSVNSKLLEYKK